MATYTECPPRGGRIRVDCGAVACPEGQGKRCCTTCRVNCSLRCWDLPEECTYRAGQRK